MDPLRYETDERRELTAGRRRNFKQGWTRAVDGQEYDDALDTLTWNNLGWRLGILFGETPDQLREELLDWCVEQREMTADSSVAATTEDPDFNDMTVEPQVIRMPILLILDTSMSMDETVQENTDRQVRKIDRLNEGVKMCKQEIEELVSIENRVDVSTMTFGGGVEVEQEFKPISDWQPSEFEAGGNTALSEAIIRGANHLEDFIDNLKGESLRYKRATIWVLTDGRATDDTREMWEKAQDVIKYGTDKNVFTLDMITIGEATETDTLRELNEMALQDWQTHILSLQKGVFKDYFRPLD